MKIPAIYRDLVIDNSTSGLTTDQLEWFDDWARDKTDVVAHYIENDKLLVTFRSIYHDEFYQHFTGEKHHSHIAEYLRA